MDNFIFKKSTIACICIVLISLLPVFAIGVYNHPSADDFGYSTAVHHAIEEGASLFTILKTAFTTSIQFMETWQGLYTAAFLLALQPAVWGEHYYFFTTFVILIMMGIGVTTLFHSIIKHLLGTSSKLGYFISLIFLSYYVHVLPSPVEGLYWYNGAVNYLFFWGLLLCNLACLITYLFEKRVFSFALILSTILCFLLSGGNHITAFIAILTNLILFAIGILTKKKYGILLPILSGVFGFVLNITSPGTAIRMAQDGQSSSVIKTLIRCGYEAISCNVKYATFSLLLLFLVLTPAILELLRKNTRMVFSFKYLIGLLLFHYMILSAMYCVPYYAMGNFGLGRVEDTIFVTYVLLAVLTYAYAIGVLKQTQVGQQIAKELEVLVSNKNRKLILELCLVFCMCNIVLVGNGKDDYSTGMKAAQELLSGEAKAYDAEYQSRLTLYEDPSQEDVLVDAFVTMPELLYLRDMTEDSNIWPNTVIAEYYHKNSISLKQN